MPSFVVNYVIQLPGLISLYYVYLWISDEKESKMFTIWDYAHIITIIASRGIVISIKYGCFSDEHMQIYRKIKLPIKLLDR